MAKIVIELNGGLVKNILAEEETDVLIINHEPCDEEEGIILDGEITYVQFMDAEENAELVDNLFHDADLQT